MPGIDFPPTKSSLHKIKDELSFAYEGYDLLNQKREILAMELVRKADVIKKLETDFQKILNELYAGYRNAAVETGSENITLQSCFETRGYFLKTDFTKLMGLKLLNLKINLKKSCPGISLPSTTAAYDEVREKSQKALQMLIEYASTTKSIFILSRELKKVQRRVNALEKIFIPEHETAKKFISDRLEEMEREEVSIKKLIGQRRPSM